MILDPALLDELARVFVEAALQRIESEAIETSGVAKEVGANVAHLMSEGRPKESVEEGEPENK